MRAKPNFFNEGHFGAVLKKEDIEESISIRVEPRKSIFRPLGGTLECSFFHVFKNL
ncbi:hypothetical protein EDC18_103367 [Natranaerovirga pectinivora]|uniref:Uncharacterized protein n=1 Tax=Natranaerovirga pectinivora TaxID=682400 RepID=A0A4R3MLV4_9FIRM|nr:hypothetical protein EDC18_103367 [Natranaerovirga pectinivora]